MVLNLFAGIWTTVLTFYLTREFLAVRSAKAAALLTGFFPSLVLWSILNIRDALATFLIVTLVLYGVRMSKRFRPFYVLIFAAALLGLGLLRDYMAFLLVAGLVIGSFSALRPDRIVGTMAFGTVAVLAFTYFADEVGLLSVIRPEEALETAQMLRVGLQVGATSAFGVGAETEAIGDALRYLPLGMSYLLFSPFPWAVETFAPTRGTARDPLVVSALLPGDSGAQNLPARAAHQRHDRACRPRHRSLQLCSGGGELRYGLPAPGPDHASVLRLLEGRAVLAEGARYCPHPVVANQDLQGVVSNRSEGRWGPAK